MIAIFDEDGGGDVDFQEFVSGLSAFSSKGNKEEKLRFAFKVYDIDRDGYISNGELFIVLKMMVGSNLKDQQLQQIVDKTIMEADLDQDGKISFEEFQKMVENTDVSMSMTLGKLSSLFCTFCGWCTDISQINSSYHDHDTRMADEHEHRRLAYPNTMHASRNCRSNPNGKFIQYHFLYSASTSPQPSSPTPQSPAYDKPPARQSHPHPQNSQ